MDKAVRVLVVEDEILCRSMLMTGLSEEGYVVEVAKDGNEALRKFAAHPPDVVLLDLLLPDMKGTEVCRLMQAESPVPVIMVSGIGAEDDVVLALDTGATDYVTKPYRLADLTARIRAVLRRIPSPPHVEAPVATRGPFDVIQVGSISMDFERREVFVSDRPVYLTRREFDLLALLLSPPDRLRTREEIVEHMWSGRGLDNSRALDAHVRRLRVKLEDDAGEPPPIVTVRGLGFLFDTEGVEECLQPVATPKPTGARSAQPSTGDHRVIGKTTAGDIVAGADRTKRRAGALT